MARLIEMRFIERDERREVGDTTRVSRAHAGILEARGVAVRVRPAHATRKPITSEHTVTKGE